LSNVVPVPKSNDKATPISLLCILNKQLQVM